jgi:hypothetical protein
MSRGIFLTAQQTDSDIVSEQLAHAQPARLPQRYDTIDASSRRPGALTSFIHTRMLQVFQ